MEDAIHEDQIYLPVARLRRTRVRYRSIVPSRRRRASGHWNRGTAVSSLSALLLRISVRLSVPVLRCPGAGLCGASAHLCSSGSGVCSGGNSAATVLLLPQHRGTTSALRLPASAAGVSKCSSAESDQRCRLSSTPDDNLSIDTKRERHSSGDIE